MAETERIRPSTKPSSTRARKPKPGMVAGRTAVALLSAVVLAATGYYWKVTDSFSDGVTKANVVEDTGEKPADGAVDILMVGVDSRTDAQGNPLSKEQLAMLNGGKSDGETNTDTLIMIRIPNNGGKPVGISIPRDSYVDIPGYGKHKVNSAYSRAKLAARGRLQKEGVSDQKELERRSNEEGAKSLIATLTKLTGATIDHYAEVNLLGFYDITNAVGGVEVCLKKATKDSLSGANFPAGTQTLQGVQALQFVRQRHGLPNGDIDRITRQQVFMSAMAKKMVSGDVLAPGSQVLDQLKTAIGKSVVLDKNWDIMRFAQQMISVTGGDVGFETIPHGTIDLTTPSDGSAVQVDPTAVKQFVTGLLTGGTPAPSSGAPTTGTADAPAAKPTVSVLNGSGRTGLAAEVADTLESQGFPTGETGNAAARSKTVVRYAKGEEAGGKSVVDALGGKATSEADTNLTKGKVTVIIGKDFSTTAGTPGERLTGAPLLDLGARAAVQTGPPCVN